MNNPKNILVHYGAYYNTHVHKSQLPLDHIRIDRMRTIYNQHFCMQTDSMHVFHNRSSLMQTFGFGDCEVVDKRGVLGESVPRDRPVVEALFRPVPHRQVEWIRTSLDQRRVVSISRSTRRLVFYLSHT